MSTSTPAGSVRSEEPDARRFERHKIRSLTYVRLGPENGGVLLDLSEGGTNFQGVEPLKKDQLLHVKFKLPGSSGALEAATQVAWLNDSKKGGGLRFVELPASDRDVIKDWLSRQATAMAPRANPAPSSTSANALPVTVIAAGLPLRRQDRDVASSAPPPAAMADEPLAATPDAAVVPPANSAAPAPAARTVGQALQTGAILRTANPAVPAPQVSGDVVYRAQGTAPPENRIPIFSAAPATPQARLSKLKSAALSPPVLYPVAGVLIVALLLLPFRGRFRPSSSDNSHIEANPAAADSPLGMKLERNGRDWQISWNRNAPAVMSASAGQLSIMSGTTHKVLDLDASELRNGSILYTPTSDSAILRLQVVGQGTTAVSESVRIIGSVQQTVVNGPRTASEGSLARLPSAPGTLRVTGPATGPASGPASSSKVPVERSANNAVVPGTIAASEPGPGSATSVPATSVPATSVAVTAPRAAPAEPAARSAESTVPSANTEAPVTVGADTKSPALTASPTQPATPERAPAAHVGALQVPRLISGKQPAYPTVAREFGLTGSVELHFVIRTDGTVHQVSVTKGNPLLAPAAVDAVLGWRYTPGMRDGVPVETESSTVIVFKPRS